MSCDKSFDFAVSRSGPLSIKIKIIRKMFTPETIFYASQKAPGKSYRSVLLLYKKGH